MKRGWALALALLAAPVAAEERPVVVGVAWPLAEFARVMAGDRAEVVYPVPEGRDPAFWRPSIAEIGAIQQADAILLNGAGFAAWVDKVSLPRRAVTVTARGLEDRLIETETVTHSHGADGAHSHRGVASHTWLDPDLGLAQAEAVAAALRRVLPEAEAEIAAGLDAVRAGYADVRAAGAELSAFASAPVIVTHPRYQYLARAFGLDVRSLEWDAGAAPTAEHLAELAALALESGARILLWEAEPPPESRAAVADLGLSDMIFPTFAHPVEGRFPSVYAERLRDLGALLEKE